MTSHDERDAAARFAGALGGGFELSRREDRWLALGDEIVGFAADDDAGWRRLAAEAWLLERWRAGGVPAARVITVDPVRRIQLRERLRGRTGEAIHSESGTSPLFDGAIPSLPARLDGAPLSVYGERVAASYGELAARIRRAVAVDAAAASGFGLGPRRTLDVDDVLARLRATTASPAAKAAADRARVWLAAIAPPDALIHADLHFHNLCTDDGGTITGVFDLGDAGIDAAATELLYVHSLGSRFAAISVAACGEVDLEEVRRAHLRVALGHLLWHGPGTPRHASIVRWLTTAFERLA